VNPWLHRILQVLAEADTLEGAREQVATILAEHDESMREALASMRGKMPLE
jgi:hypothetical protein